MKPSLALHLLGMINFDCTFLSSENLEFIYKIVNRKTFNFIELLLYELLKALLLFSTGKTLWVYLLSWLEHGWLGYHILETRDIFF